MGVRVIFACPTVNIFYYIYLETPFLTNLNYQQASRCLMDQETDHLASGAYSVKSDEGIRCG